MKLSKELIKEIAEEQDCGMLCYVHKTTLKLEIYPKELNDDSDLIEIWSDVIDKVNESYKDYVKIESMESFERFKMMEIFTSNIQDQNLKNQLFNILESTKPFRNWKNTIESDSNYRDSWFAFKNEKLKEYVQMQFSE